MPSYLGAIGTANPVHRIAQPHIADFMAQALAFGENDARKLYRVSGIEHRYSVVPDYGRPMATTRFSLTPPTWSLFRVWASAFARKLAPQRQNLIMLILP